MPAGGERLPDAVRRRDEDDAQQQPTSCSVQLPHALLARPNDSSILCLSQIMELPSVQRRLGVVCGRGMAARWPANHTLKGLMRSSSQSAAECGYCVYFCRSPTDVLPAA